MINPHASHPTSLTALLRSMWQHRQLISQMIRREVIGRYRGSAMGLAWSFFNPILMLIVYTFVFSVVFKARWGVGVEESKVDFAIILFVGMIVNGLFAECINRAPTLILGNVNFVKKVIFPLEILPVVAMGSVLFHTIISTVVLLAAILITGTGLSWTILFFPIVIFPLLLVTMGFTWFLAALGVYVRDIAQLTGMVTTVMMFLAPVFYPLSSLPEKYQTLLQLNPLTFVIEESRRVVIFGVLPNFTGWFLYFAISILIALIGFAWFQKTRKGFADVL